MADEAVRCSECNRTCTYHRLGKNPWFLVAGPGVPTKFLCEFCLDKLDPADVPHVEIIIGDTPNTVRYCHLEFT